MSLPHGILFNESYVLAIHIAPYSVYMKMDFRLTEDHPLYEKPLEPDGGNFMLGEIVVSGFRTVEWEATGAPPAIEASGGLDFGCLDQIDEISGGWLLGGDWGQLRVLGGSLSATMQPA